MTRNRWLSLVLFVSVALNLALLGMIGAHMWRQREDRPPGPISRQLSPPWDEKARELRRARRPEAMELVRAIRAARADARETLTTEPFDAGRLADALERLRVANEALQRHVQTGFVDLARQVPPEERQKLARVIPGGEPPDRHPRGDGPPPGGPPGRPR
jgi:uncharacterized membrane protein